MTAARPSAGPDVRRASPAPVHELSQRFYFEAAHTLERAVEDGRDASRRVHGHTYRARVTVRGTPDAATGMVVDLARLRAAIERARARLDHRLLDEVADLGPATLENLCSYLYRALDDPAWVVVRVDVGREASGDACCLRLPDRDPAGP